MKFHSRHGREVSLSDGRTLSEVSTGPGSRTVFSHQPIKAGQNINLEIIEFQEEVLVPSLWIGVTTTDPTDYNLSIPPMDHKDTWCIDTWRGHIYVNGKDAGVGDGWKKRFGGSRNLKSGDVIRLSLKQDQSVSISLNGKECKDVFSCQLPDTDLWVVIKQCVKKIKLVSPDVYTLQQYCCQVILEETCGSQINQLPLPCYIKNGLLEKL